MITDSNYKRKNNNDSVSPRCDAAHADIVAPALDFSSLLASIATLSDEQKQQLREALLAQPSVQSSEALPTASPLPQPERETVQLAEQQQPRKALLAQSSAQPSEALPTAPLLPQPERETVQLAEQQRHENPAPPPETRSKPPKDTSPAGRIEAVFLCLDKLAQQTTGDPDFIWTRSERAKRSVKQLLADGRVVTPEKLSAVYLHMATMKPDPKTGFTWANKLSIANVCNNYDSIWLEIVKAKQLKDAASLPGAATGAPALRTLVIFGNTDHGISSQPLPVAPPRRDFPPRRFVGRGV